MKPALCFNSKKLQNIYKLDAITTADSATILNNKNRPQNLANPAHHQVSFAENRQAFLACGKMTVFDSSLPHWEEPGTEKPGRWNENIVILARLRKPRKTWIEGALEDHQRKVWQLECFIFLSFVFLYISKTILKTRVLLIVTFGWTVAFHLSVCLLCWRISEPKLVPAGLIWLFDDIAVNSRILLYFAVNATFFMWLHALGLL